MLIRLCPVFDLFRAHFRRLICMTDPLAGWTSCLILRGQSLGVYPGEMRKVDTKNLQDILDNVLNTWRLLVLNTCFSLFFRIHNATDRCGYARAVCRLFTTEQRLIFGKINSIIWQTCTFIVASPRTKMSISWCGVNINLAILELKRIICARVTNYLFCDICRVFVEFKVSRSEAEG